MSLDEARRNFGWTEFDVVLVSGDAYIDHPSFGAGLVGRWLEHLGLRAYLNLDLRLGEGSGAALFLPLVDTAQAILSEMATFESAGVSDKA